MKILITGASGLVGSRLCQKIIEENLAEIVVTSRRPEKFFKTFCLPPELVTVIPWDGQSDFPLSALKEVDAVVNLAGEAVAEGRWSEEKKKRIYDSRIVGTRKLTQAIEKSLPRPSVMLSASAIGFYGDRPGEELVEDSRPGQDFLAKVCMDWEKESLRPLDSVRQVALRIGVVLSSPGGALSKMLPPFLLGAGGPLGQGRFHMSWIHLEDLVDMILYCLKDPTRQGAHNAVSPNPCTNKHFTRTMAQVLKRPALFPVPPLMLKFLFGEMAQILLADQKVLPKKIQQSQFTFRYPHIQGALENLLTHFVTGENTLTRFQHIGRKREELFSFFGQAKNLAQITPKELGFKITEQSTPELASGSLIKYKISLHGLPITWQSKIADWHPPHEFVDTQEKGPYKKWHHHHQFLERPKGTLMVDRIKYQVPGGPLAFLIDQLFVQKDLKNIFDYRHAKIREFFPEN